MLSNLNLQLCGLFNTILLAVFYLMNRRLKLYKSQMFSWLIWITVLSIALDLICVLAIYDADMLLREVLHRIYALYACGAVLEGRAALIYAYSDFWPERLHRKCLPAVIGVTAVELLAFEFLPIDVSFAWRQYFLHGAGVNLIYASLALDIFLIFLGTFLYKHRISKRRTFAFRFWMLVWMLAMAIQWTHPTVPGASFAASLGVIVIFVVLENPERTIDQQYACYSESALFEYIHEGIEQGHPYAVCNISLRNIEPSKDKDYKIYKLKRHILAKLMENQEILVFNLFNLKCVLVAPTVFMMEQAIAEYQKYFNETHFDFLESEIYLIEDLRVLRSADDMLKLFNYLDGKTKNVLEHEIVRITAREAQRFYRTEQVREEIQQVLKEDRVEAFFQPIYNMGEKKFTSAEVLVRIRRKDGTIMPPSEFIPVAEANGQVFAIGERMLEKTCQFLADGKARELGVEYLEVNLSVLQCESPTMTHKILQMVEEYGISADQLNFEITETMSIRAKQQILKNMEQMESYGFSFSLDDFGQGESNLMYVVNMPFRILKLDMDMTKAYQKNPKARLVVASVERMAHEMGMKIVAEGIETEEEFHSMEACGIDYIQGYYFSKPLSREEYIAFLEKKAKES